MGTFAVALVSGLGLLAGFLGMVLILYFVSLGMRRRP